jgi:hypothetical protein
MKLHLAILPLASQLILFSVACQDGPTEASGQFDISAFPMAVGSEWTYAVYDNELDSSFTMTVEISDTTTLPTGEHATIWVYMYGNAPDTEYVYIAGDTVTIRAGSYVRSTSARLVFPLEVGNEWNGLTFDDTSTVLQLSSVTVPAGTFTGAYPIERKWGALNVYGSNTCWFLPGVGLVKKIRHEYGWLIYADESWELIDYDIHGQ